MAKRVGLDGLADAITEVLEEYETEMERGTKEAVQKVAKAGVKALRQTSPKRANGGGYAKGWTADVTDGRLHAEAKIYNAAKPGLPHLLEKGHVTRNGTGRTFNPTPAHVHIAPVEAQISEEFEHMIEEVIEG